MRGDPIKQWNPPPTPEATCSSASDSRGMSWTKAASPVLSAVSRTLGIALHGAGSVEAAVESLETALQFQPDLGETHGILSRVLRSKGDLARAAQHEAAHLALRRQ